jgi:predicted metal-binding membrane protein
VVSADLFARIRNVALLVSAVAWTALLMQPAAAMHHASMALPASAPIVPSVNWAWMLVAMMTPSLIPPITHLVSRSFRRRRWRSVALFVVGYAAIWMIEGGVSVVVLSGNAWSSLPWQVTVAAALVIAVAWQCSPIKQHCLNRCHLQPAIAAFGTAADRAALEYGITHGLWCVGSCWALMLVPTLLPRGHLVAMVGVAGLIFTERLERPRPARWGLRSVTRVRRVVAALSERSLETARVTPPFAGLASPD